MNGAARRPALGLWIAVLGLIAAAWASTLSGDFLLDDYGLSMFAHDDGSVDWKQVGRFFFPSHLTRDQFLRPIPVTAGAIDIHFWGGNAFGYHLTNLLIHLATALAVGLVAARLCRRAATGPLVTLLYGLYPGHVESVSWIIHRMVGMTVFFIALTLLFHARRPWRPFAWVAALAGLACKEPAAILPAAVFLFDCARGTAPWRRRLLDAIKAALPYVGVIAVYVLWKWLAFGKLSTGYGKYASYGDYFFGEAVYLEIPMSVVRFLFPLNASVSSSAYGLREWVGTAFPIVLGVVLLITVIAGLRCPDTRRLAVFGGLLAISSLGLVSPFLRVSAELTNSRHFSAPAMGLVMSIGAGALSFSSLRAKLLIGVALVMWFSVLPVNQRPYAEAGRLARETREGIAARLAERRDSPYEEGTVLFVANVPDSIHGAPVFGDASMLDAVLSPPFVSLDVAKVCARCRIVTTVGRWSNATGWRGPQGDPGTVLYSVGGPLVVLEVGFGYHGSLVVSEVGGPMPRWEPAAETGGSILAPVGDRPVRLVDDPPFSFRFPDEYDHFRLVFEIGARRAAFKVARDDHLETDPDGRLTYRLSRGDCAGRRNLLARDDISRLRGPVTWWVEAVSDPPSALNDVYLRTPSAGFVVVP